MFFFFKVCSIIRFGRRFVVLWSHLQLLVSGVAGAFSPNIYVYMVFKFLGGMADSGIITHVFVVGRYT